MVDVHYCHYPVLVVDPVDDSVGPATRAEPVVHRREKPLPNPVGLFQEGTSDELIGCRRDSLRESLIQRATDGRGRPQLVRIFRRLAAHCAWRSLIASASSSAETYSPRASSASDSAKRF